MEIEVLYQEAERAYPTLSVAEVKTTLESSLPKFSAITNTLIRDFNCAFPGYSGKSPLPAPFSATQKQALFELLGGDVEKRVSDMFDDALVRNGRLIESTGRLFKQIGLLMESDEALAQSIAEMYSLVLPHMNSSHPEHEITDVALAYVQAADSIRAGCHVTTVLLSPESRLSDSQKALLFSTLEKDDATSAQVFLRDEALSQRGFGYDADTISTIQAIQVVKRMEPRTVHVLAYRERNIAHVKALIASGGLYNRSAGEYLVDQGILRMFDEKGRVIFAPVEVQNDPEKTADNQAIVAAWREAALARMIAEGAIVIPPSSGGGLAITEALYAPLVIKDSVLKRHVLTETKVRAILDRQFPGVDEKDIVVSVHPDGKHYTISARKGDTTYIFHLPIRFRVAA